MAEKTRKPMNPALRQWLVPIAVLVCICLVCGLLLALCNDLLYVSDEDKLNRAMGKIYSAYGEGDKEWNAANANFAAVDNDYGTITDIKKAADGAYVISAKGGGGYNSGGVTIYLVVKQEVVNGKNDAIIKAWTIKENDGQTFLGNITGKQQTSWYVGKSITDFKGDGFAVSNNKVSGTTLTSTAINNAVKSACQYCVDDLKLVSTPESEARDALVELLGADYASYTFTSVADADGFAGFKVGEQELSFYFEGSDGTNSVEAYVYGEGADRQIVVVKAGLTHAERLAQEVVAKSDNAADDVVNKVKGLSYFEYLVRKSHEGFVYAGMAEVDSSFTSDKGTVGKVYTSTDGSVVIQATGNGGWEEGTVTINVVIANGTIKGWWIVGHEKQSFLQGNILEDWDNCKKWFVGESIDTVFTTATPDKNPTEGKGSGATYSENAITNAINTACAYARSLAD